MVGKNVFILCRPHCNTGYSLIIPCIKLKCNIRKHVKKLKLHAISEHETFFAIYSIKQSRCSCIASMGQVGSNSTSLRRFNRLQETYSCRGHTFAYKAASYEQRKKSLFYGYHHTVVFWGTKQLMA